MINDHLKSLIKAEVFTDTSGNLVPFKDVLIELTTLSQAVTTSEQYVRVKNKIMFLEKLKVKLESAIRNITNELVTSNFPNKYSAFSSFFILNKDVDPDSTSFFNSVNVSLSTNTNQLKNLRHELQIVNYKLKIMNDYLTTLYSNTTTYDGVLTDLKSI